MSEKPIFHFEISERKIFLRLFDTFFVLLALSIVGITFQFGYFRIDSQYWVWTVVLVVFFNFFATVFELYDLQKSSKFDSVFQNVILSTSLTVLFYILTPYITPSLPENRLQILFFFLSIAVILLLWRYAYIALITSPRFYKRVLVVGDSFDIKLIADTLRNSDPNYSVIGYINTENEIEAGLDEGLIRFKVEDLSSVVEEYHINEVIVAHAHKRNLMITLYNQLNELLMRGFPIRDYFHVYEETTRRIPVDKVDKDFYRYFPFSRNNANQFYRLSSRIFDVLTGIIGVFFGLLILPFILLGNLFGNRGKLFYSQERIGKYGKTFKILKFRTMLRNAEMSGPQYAQKDDLRITPFGKFLRRSRIDEIPQFINVLKGEMSMIGPRPERPVFVKELSQAIPFYETRHVIKPGLTGWAQVMANYGTSHTDSLEKLQYDLYYIKHRGLFLDIDILMKTFSTIIFYRGQ
ncbi:sugar transferase [Autumnicola psychrophila]|uniref:Sugar transferase n=1 Tax=Autumnicola psychrophila TaxID=3075592 RepID=A0ABU3DSZ1_9FLAO|nr:sugar transferase [Zunongwangia sp. F225]MDT0686831.1 sugar transferase [Zunongwangia sp. F225]